MFRRFATALATVALMWHSLAMLLAVALAPVAPASALPAFMEICTPEGIVYLPFDQPLNQDTPQAPQRHDSGGSVEGCPVCTAFGQMSGTAPPSAIMLQALFDNAAPMHLPQVVAPQGRAAQLPQSRAPPRLG